MPLRYKYKKEHEAEIPEALKSNYVLRDGNYILDVEGVVEASELAEFRDNNRQLTRLLGAGVKTHEDAIARLEKIKDIDPEKYQKALDDLKSIESGKYPKLEELVSQRSEAMRTDFDNKLKEKDATIATTKQRLEKVLIDDALITSASKKGVIVSALEDVKNRGRTVFKLEDENVIAIGPDGKRMYGVDGKVMSMDEWMDKLAETAGHLFKPNSGTGGKGSGDSSGFSGKNPYSKKSHNLTLQAKLERENPALAKSLQAQAANE